MKNYEQKNMDEFAKCADISNGFYWHLVNRCRRIKSRKPNPVKLQNGTVLTQLDDLKQAWYDHFITLYTPVENAKYDQQWYEFVNRTVQHHAVNSLNDEVSLFKHTFTNHELVHCINKLKLKKSTGWDRISSEHVKHGSKELKCWLLVLFNKMLVNELMPMNLKKGVLVPIPKGDKNPVFRENNRGITLLPVLNKLYQSMIKYRMDTYSYLDDNIDVSQGAGKAKISCNHSSLALREIVQVNL